MRNPSWSRDELILALDFYFEHSPNIPGKNSDEVSQLSLLLNRLQLKLGGESSDTYRNLNGVYMKLMNFRAIDPAYEGVGLRRGNKDEPVVWSLYSDRRPGLRSVATAIRSLVSSPNPIPSAGIDFEDEATEGRVLSRLHHYRERDSRIVRRKKNQMLKAQKVLRCEVCQFDFELFYGPRGHGFIECHHNRPVSELLEGGEMIRLRDLSLLCSNCHRMAHRAKPWLSIDELILLVKGSNWGSIEPIPNQ